MREERNKTAEKNNAKVFKGVVAFDLDGTLIRGIRHSWSLLWKSINCGREESIQYQKYFSDGKIDYKQWVQHDFEILHNNGLTLDKIHATIKKSKCSLAKNLNKAIIKLKEHGYVVAIISGGVDAVLRYFLSDPLELFDVIYINELVWDADGHLKAIIPTEYDWDSSKKGVLGKCAGLKKICEDFGVPLSNSVFVGNDDNDLMAMRIAGRKIYFSAHALEKQKIDFEGLHIERRNDLLKVVDFIINE